MIQKLIRIKTVKKIEICNFLTCTGCTGCKSKKCPETKGLINQKCHAFSPRQVETVLSFVSWLLYGIRRLTKFQNVSLHNSFFPINKSKNHRDV